MKTSSIYLLTFSLLLTATLATGCRKGLSEGDNGASANGMIQVSFQSGALTIAQVGNSNGWESSVPYSKADPETGPEVTTPDRLPVGTTFRLVVYNAGDNPKTAEPVAQNTYKVADTEGKVLATLVDEFGTALEGTDTSAIILRRGDYDFYYFSPAIPIGKTSVATYSDLGQDIDYMALYQRQSVDPSKGRLHGVTEVNFYRMASYIDIKIAPREGEIIGTLEVDPNNGLEVFGFTNTGYYEIGGYPYYLATEGTGGMVAYSATDFGAVPDQTATISTEEVDGGHIVLPGVASDLRISGVVLSDGATKRFSTSLGTQIFEPGYRYLIELGISRVAEDPTVDITVLPWNEVDWDNTDIGGKYPPIDASVTPDPTDGYVSVVGEEFTVTLASPAMWTTPVNIRAWDVEKEEVVATGTVTYSSSQGGGSGTITIGQNTQETMRRMLFQYEWAEKWYEIPKLAQQQGSLLDVGANILFQNPDPRTKYSWTDGINYCSGLGEGWRLPTENELLYASVISGVFTDEAAFQTAYYWSATNYIPKASTEAWFVYPTSGDALYASINSGFNLMVKTYALPIRCVKPKPETAAKATYPYITRSQDGYNSFIVVLNDKNGGIPTSALAQQRYTETQHNSTTVSRKFRIQNQSVDLTTKKWPEARNYCDNLVAEGCNDWRLPSRLELSLIWVLGASSDVGNGDQNDTGSGDGSIPVSQSKYLSNTEGFNTFQSDQYIASTYGESSSIPGLWLAGMVDFSSGMSGSFDRSKYVRCIRDEEWE